MYGLPYCFYNAAFDEQVVNFNEIQPINVLVPFHILFLFHVKRLLPSFSTGKMAFLKKFLNIVILQELKKYQCMKPGLG